MAFSGLLGEGAGTITQGQRRLATIGSARAKPQVIEKLVYINANVSPLRVLMQKLGTVKSVGQASYSHFETDEVPTQVQVSGSQTSSDVSIELTTNHGKRVNVNDLLINTRTDEEVRVTAISGDTLTVERDANGSTAAAMNNLDELHIVGMADTDGNTAPSGVSSEPTQVINYVQIFKEAVELSGRDIHADVFTEDEKARVLKDGMGRMLRKIEKRYFFGNTLNSSDPYVTAGLDYWITTNVTAQAGAALDEQTWNNFLRNCWRRNQGSKNVVLFLGTNTAETLDSFGRDVIRYAPEDKLLGIKVGRYQNSFGDLGFIRHGLLDDVLGSEASYGRWGGRNFFVNMDLVGRAVFKGRDMRMESDIETPGTDGKKWQWVSDEGLCVKNEKAHGMMTGVPSL